MEPVRIRTQLLTFKIFSNVQNFNNCAGVVSLSHITSFDELKDRIRELRPTVTAADLQASVVLFVNTPHIVFSAVMSASWSCGVSALDASRNWLVPGYAEPDCRAVSRRPD